MATQTATPNTSQEVQDLNAGWRNFLAEQMGMDKNTFQLAQGTLGLQTADNSGVFLMADAVPPSTAIAYYDPSSMTSRSQNYGSLLAALLPETNPQALRNALGNYYTDWINWKVANKPASGQSYVDYFKTWAMQSSIDPGTAARAESVIIQTQNAPLTQALLNFYNTTAYQQQFSPAGQPQFSLYVYSGTTDGAQTAINNGGSIPSISFNTESMDTSLSHTFVNGSASGFYDIFSGGVSGSFEQLNTKAAGSSLSITGHINKYGTLVTGPGGWYASNEVTRAVNAPNNNTIWDPGTSAGNWDTFFQQPNGGLARYVTSLLLVSDFSITVTSHATYSQEDFQQIKTEASFGIWPFFSAHASATHTTDVTLNSDSTLSTTFTLPAGSIQIWGVNVQNQVQSS